MSLGHSVGQSVTLSKRMTIEKPGVGWPLLGPAMSESGRKL